MSVSKGAKSKGAAKTPKDQSGAKGTRERIVDASAELLRLQGYTGTGVKQIVAAAGAPFGSLYHFFPGGKEELAEETVRTSGALYGQLIPAFFGAPGTPFEGDLVKSMKSFFAAAAVNLEESGYRDGCPIATVALETANTSERLRIATAEVFESWIVAAAERFEAAGLSKKKARELAITIFNLLEGAFVLAQAARSVEALHVAGKTATITTKAFLEN